MLDVGFEPPQLLVAKGTEAAGFQIHHVYQTDKVHAFLVEAVPAGALCIFAVTIKELLAIVANEIVFAGYVVNIFGNARLKDLIDGIELFGFSEVAYIAGVQQKLRGYTQGIDLLDCRVEGSDDVLVCGLVEAHVAVADLNETEVTLGVSDGKIAGTAEAVGLQHAAAQHAERAGTGPGHAFQE